MPPLSPSAFADALATLDRDELVRFVVALERARGRTATAEGGVVVSRDGADERRLWVYAPRWRRLRSGGSPQPPAGVDAVVTPLREPGFDVDAAVIDADDLRDAALYAVPAAERDALFAAHLGRGPAATDDGPGREAIVAALAVVAVVAAGVVAAVGAGGERPSAASSTAESAATATPAAGGERYPPGVSAAGVVDPDRLGRAHEAALADESYVLTSDRTVRYANGTVRSRLSVEVRLATNRTYLARAETAGPHAPVFLGRPPARGTYWSNGSVYARRLSRDGRQVYNTFEPLGGAATWRYWVGTVPFGGGQDGPSETYARIFETVPVDVVSTKEPDGVRRALLTGDEAPPDAFGVGTDVRDVTLSARVTGDGVVRRLLLRYETTVDGETVRVTWRVRYDAVGRTTVERPSWLGRALDGDRTTATATQTPAASTVREGRAGAERRQRRHNYSAVSSDPAPYTRPKTSASVSAD